MTDYDAIFETGRKFRDETLGPLGLNPDEWDLEYTPERPRLRSTDEAYRGLFDRVAPILSNVFREEDFDSPLARILVRLGQAGGDYVKGGVEARQRDIVAQNQLEKERANQVNMARRSEVSGNRTAYRSAMRERLVPRAVVEQKLARDAEEEENRVKARTNAYRAEGLNPPGTPPTKTPKKPDVWNPTSFRLFSDADKMAIDDLNDELKALKSDWATRSAFEPQPKDRKGNTIPDKSPRVREARIRIAAINRQIHEARKQSIMYHLRRISADAAASPENAKAMLGEVYRAAQALKLDSDPDVNALAEEVKGTIRGGR